MRNRQVEAGNDEHAEVGQRIIAEVKQSERWCEEEEEEEGQEEGQACIFVFQDEAWPHQTRSISALNEEIRDYPIITGVNVYAAIFELVINIIIDLSYAWLSFPALLILLTVMALLGPGMVQMISVLGAFWGIANIRTVREVVLSTKENLYVKAAQAIGVPSWRILL